MRHLQAIRQGLGTRNRSNRKRVTQRSGRKYTIIIEEYKLCGRSVFLSRREVNPFWFTMDVNDPTVDDEERMWRIIDRLPKGDAKLSEMEIAWDLQPEPPGYVMLIKRQVLKHLLLPHAHAGPRPHAANEYGLDLTWYYGSQRGGPRNVKVYDKTLVGEQPVDVVRIEWTIHGRFGNYGIDPRHVTRLDELRVEKLLRWGWFDRDRAAELAYRRHHGHRLHPRDPWRGLVLAHYRRAIQDELAGGWGAGHVLVLGQMKQRYKALDWTRPHEIPKVFPPLP